MEDRNLVANLKKLSTDAHIIPEILSSLLTDHSALEYTLKRVLAGMISPSASQQLNYSVLLKMLLSKFKHINPLEFLSRLNEDFSEKKAVVAKEKKYIKLGKVLAYGCLLRAGRGIEEQVLSELIEIAKKDLWTADVIQQIILRAGKVDPTIFELLISKFGRSIINEVNGLSIYLSTNGKLSGKKAENIGNRITAKSVVAEATRPQTTSFSLKWMMRTLVRSSKGVNGLLNEIEGGVIPVKCKVSLLLSLLLEIVKSPESSFESISLVNSILINNWLRNSQGRHPAFRLLSAKIASALQKKPIAGFSTFLQVIRNPESQHFLSKKDPITIMIRACLAKVPADATVYSKAISSRLSASVDKKETRFLVNELIALALPLRSTDFTIVIEKSKEDELLKEWLWELTTAITPAELSSMKASSLTKANKKALKILEESDTLPKEKSVALLSFFNTLFLQTQIDPRDAELLQEFFGLIPIISTPKGITALLEILIQSLSHSSSNNFCNFKMW